MKFVAPKQINTVLGLLALSLTGLAYIFLAPRFNFFQSDILYLPSLVHDTLNITQKPWGWSYPPAPYWFPDLFVYSVLLLLFQSVEYALYAYGFLQFILAAVVLDRVNLIFYKASGFLYISILFLILLSGWQGFSVFFLPSIHTSALLFSLLFWQKTRTSKKLGWLWFVSMILLFVSDRLILLLYFFPYFLSRLDLAVRTVQRHRKFPEKQMSLSVGVQYAVWICKRTIHWQKHKRLEKNPFTAMVSGWILWIIFKSVLQIEKTPSLGIFGSMQNFWSSMLQVSEKEWMFPILFALSILALLAALRLRFSSRTVRFPTKDSVFLFGFLFASLLLPIVSGTFTDPYSFRYMTGFIVLPVILLPKYLETLFRINSRIFAFGIVILLGISVYFSKLPPIANWKIQSITYDQYPIQCLEGLAEKKRVSWIVADYWHAKPIEVFSARDIMVVYPDPLSWDPSPTMTNRLRFRRRGGRYLYPGDPKLVVVEGLDRSRLEELWGPPKQITKCESLSIWLY